MDRTRRWRKFPTIMNLEKKIGIQSVRIIHAHKSNNAYNTISPCKRLQYVIVSFQFIPGIPTISQSVAFPVPCFGSLPLCLPRCDPVRRRGATWVVPCCGFPVVSPNRWAPGLHGGLLGLVGLPVGAPLCCVCVIVVSCGFCCLCYLCCFCVFFMFVVGSFQSVSWKFDFWISLNFELLWIVCVVCCLEVSSL